MNAIVRDQDLVQRYIGDFFEGILSAIRPSFAAIDYVRKKRATHRFKNLLLLRALPQEEKKRILVRLIQALPKETTKEAYMDSQREIMAILAEELKEIFEEAARLYEFIDKSELEKSLRLEIMRSRGIVNSLRENIAEIILATESDEERMKYIVIDQALSLLNELYTRILEKPDERGELSIYILMLQLRVLATLEGMSNYELLHEDMIEISPEISEEDGIPDIVVKLMM